jgi:hypothetical protein
MTEFVVTKIAAFDYTAVPADTTEILRSTALRIKDRMQASIIDTGRDLLAVKNMLGHGAFGHWLKVEFGSTDRTARNFMGAAELADAKSEIVSVLPATVLYRLASPSTPDAVRDAMVSRLERGETVSKADISDAVDRHLQDEAEAKRVARLSPAKLKRERLSKEQRERKLEAQRLEWKKEEQERKEAARRAVTMLLDRLPSDQLKEFANLYDAAGWEFGRELRKEITR